MTLEAALELLANNVLTVGVNLLTVGGYLFLIALLLTPLVLTFAMFHTKNPMLGFPCGIFWGVFAGYSYIQSTATWDIYYLLFFASIGMVIFCILSAFTLRKKDLDAPNADKGKFIDEGKGDTVSTDETTHPTKSTTESLRAQNLHQRAKERRTN